MGQDSSKQKSKHDNETDINETDIRLRIIYDVYRKVSRLSRGTFAGSGGSDLDELEGKLRRAGVDSKTVKSMRSEYEWHPEVLERYMNDRDPSFFAMMETERKMQTAAATAEGISRLETIKTKQQEQQDAKMMERKMAVMMAARERKKERDALEKAEMEKEGISPLSVRVYRCESGRCNGMNIDASERGPNDYSSYKRCVIGCGNLYNSKTIDAFGAGQVFAELKGGRELGNMVGSFLAPHFFEMRAVPDDEVPKFAESASRSLGMAQILDNKMLRSEIRNENGGDPENDDDDDDAYPQILDGIQDISDLAIFSPRFALRKVEHKRVRLVEVVNDLIALEGGDSKAAVVSRPFRLDAEMVPRFIFKLDHYSMAVVVTEEGSNARRGQVIMLKHGQVVKRHAFDGFGIVSKFDSSGRNVFGVFTPDFKSPELLIKKWSWTSNDVETFKYSKDLLRPFASNQVFFVENAKYSMYHLFLDGDGDFYVKGVNFKDGVEDVEDYYIDVHSKRHLVDSRFAMEKLPDDGFLIWRYAASNTSKKIYGAYFHPRQENEALLRTLHRNRTGHPFALCAAFADDGDWAIHIIGDDFLR